MYASVEPVLVVSNAAVAPASPDKSGTASVSGNVSAPEAELSVEQQQKRAAAEKRLWWWNMSCGILHLVQAIAVLGVGASSKTTVGQFRLPQQTNFVVLAPDNKGFITQVVTRYQFPFAAVTSGFAWLSAAAHFSVLLGFKKYVADLRQGLNQFRWWEYAASSSLMIVLISMLCGNYDVLSLFQLGSINACMNLFGLLMERDNRWTKRTDWMPFWMGCFAGLVPWVVVFSYLGSWDSSKVPGFVYAIILVYLVLFCTFPTNMVLQYRGIGPWKAKVWGGRGNDGYYYGEKVYMILSLVAKSLLLWLVVGGVNQPNSYTGNAAK